MKGLILIAMIFCHIVDDYYLQGVLASMKQKEWWEKNTPNPLYKHDYLMALFMHSFSWACSIMLLPTIFVLVTDGKLPVVFFAFIVNVISHMFIDNLKANRKEINLMADQCLHLWQIILTWNLLMFM